MHERVRTFLTTAAALAAVVAIASCSAVRLEPAYSACGANTVNPACAISTERAEVLYEADCEGECQVRFSLPMANLGSEQFSGDFRRRVTFPGATTRSVTMEVAPTADTFTVRRARIRVDGAARSWLDAGDVRPGKTVVLSATVGGR